MTTIHSFEFNPFAEKTYLLQDSNKNCIIIDPGCYQAFEKEMLLEYIRTNNLHPTDIWLTHSHLDHIFGVKFVAEYFDIPISAHNNSTEGISLQPSISSMYGIACDPCPQPNILLNNNDIIHWGENTFHVIYCPGHSNDSIVFYNQAENYIISGDVLFQGSIGRTDLPGGDLNTLLHHLKNEILTLPENVMVYAGHGDKTSIGKEKIFNPYLQF